MESEWHRPKDRLAGVQIGLKFEHGPASILVSGHRRPQPCQNSVWLDDTASSGCKLTDLLLLLQIAVLARDEMS